MTPTMMMKANSSPRSHRHSPAAARSAHQRTHRHNNNNKSSFSYYNQEETLKALIDFIEQQQSDDYYKIFPPKLLQQQGDADAINKDNDNNDNKENDNNMDSVISHSSSTQNFLNMSSDDNLRNSVVIDQVFCTLTDLDSNRCCDDDDVDKTNDNNNSDNDDYSDINLLQDNILHGVLYVCRNGLSFAGVRRASLQRICWTSSWHMIDQLRVSYNTDQLCLYAITKKSGFEQQNDGGVKSKNDDNDRREKKKGRRGSLLDDMIEATLKSNDGENGEHGSKVGEGGSGSGSGGMSEETLNRILMSDDNDDGMRDYDDDSDEYDDQRLLEELNNETYDSKEIDFDDLDLLNDELNDDEYNYDDDDDDNGDEDFNLELRPYLFTIQAFNSDLLLGEMFTKDQELIMSSQSSSSSSSSGHGYQQDTGDHGRIMSDIYAQKRRSETYSSSQSATMDLSELNISNIRSTRWRSLLYVISEYSKRDVKQKQDKKKQTQKQRKRTSNHAHENDSGGEQQSNFESLFGDQMRRAFVYNLNFFKNIQLMTVEIPEFNMSTGMLQRGSVDVVDRVAIEDYMGSPSDDANHHGADRHQQDQSMDADMREQRRREEEQEERVNKTNSNSVIIKDYFQNEDDEVTMTESIMEDDLATYDYDGDMDVMMMKQSMNDRFSLSNIFHKSKSSQPIQIPLHPNRNVLLEYRDLVIGRSSFMKMSYKMVPVVLRVEEDKTTKQVTLAIYAHNAKRLKLLDKNMYDIGSMKKIEVSGQNREFLSIEMANNSLYEMIVPGSEDVTRWTFGQTSHSHDGKSMDTISSEIYAVYFKLCASRK